MRKPRVSVFVGISLDGYIAGTDGDLSWLAAVETVPPENTGYDALMDESDALVVLGKGIALFSADTPLSAWRLDTAQAFPSGLLQGRYLPCR